MHVEREREREAQREKQRQKEHTARETEKKNTFRDGDNVTQRKRLTQSKRGRKERERE